MQMLGRSFLLTMKAGGFFQFAAREAVGDHSVRGYDDEGNWLQISLDDIERVRLN
jgi:hypothetical protein